MSFSSFLTQERRGALKFDFGLYINSFGKIEGHILNKKKGRNGFGYDPIFKPLNKRLTFGEMKSQDKYKIDHRFQAFKKIKKFF